MKVLIILQHRFDLWQMPSWLLDRVRKEFPQIDFVYLSSYDRVEAEIGDAEVVVAWSLRSEQLRAAKKLRWIHSPAAAVHEILLPEVVNSDILVTNGRDVHGHVVAESVTAMVLALAKKFPEAARYQQKRVWGQQDLWQTLPHPREVADATLGLVGLGTIGSAAAKHAVALGMRVIAVREHPEKGSPPGVERVYGPDQLDTLLAESDYVALVAPLTGSTRNLIDASRLTKMKPSACLINVGRGALVDEAALAEALMNKTIAGAALDVFVEEPLPASSPLWDMENVLITPHTAGLTERQWERQYTLLAQNLHHYLNREPLQALVDKQKGY